MMRSVIIHHCLSNEPLDVILFISKNSTIRSLWFSFSVVKDEGEKINSNQIVLVRINNNETQKRNLGHKLQVNFAFELTRQLVI